MKLYVKEKSYELYNGDMLDMEVDKDYTIEDLELDKEWEE